MYSINKWSEKCAIEVLFLNEPVDIIERDLRQQNVLVLKILILLQKQHLVTTLNHCEYYKKLRLQKTEV